MSRKADRNTGNEHRCFLLTRCGSTGYLIARSSESWSGNPSGIRLITIRLRDPSTVERHHVNRRSQDVGAGDGEDRPAPCFHPSGMTNRSRAMKGFPGAWQAVVNISLPDKIWALREDGSLGTLAQLLGLIYSEEFVETSSSKTSVFFFPAVEPAPAGEAPPPQRHLSGPHMRLPDPRSADVTFDLWASKWLTLTDGGQAVGIPGSEGWDGAGTLAFSSQLSLRNEEAFFNVRSRVPVPRRARILTAAL